MVLFDTAVRVIQWGAKEADKAAEKLAVKAIEVIGKPNVEDLKGDKGTGSGPRRVENKDRIPSAPSEFNCFPRAVYLGVRHVGVPLLHVVDPVSTVEPDTTKHWSVIVGDWYHQLQATDLRGGWNYYDNNKVEDSQLWTKFPMATTSFNDAAIAKAGMNSFPLSH